LTPPPPINLLELSHCFYWEQ